MFSVTVFVRSAFCDLNVALGFLSVLGIEYGDSQVGRVYTSRSHEERYPCATLCSQQLSCCLAAKLEWSRNWSRVR